MKNYFEILMYSDRMDLKIENTYEKDEYGTHICGSYLGFKTNTTSKTIFVLPNDFEEMEIFLKELKNTHYRNSNLYKLAKEMIIDFSIQSCDYLWDIDEEPKERFFSWLCYFMKEYDIEISTSSKEYLEKANIKYLEDKEKFVSNEYYIQYKAIKEILKSKRVILTESNKDLILEILPNSVELETKEDYRYEISMNIPISTSDLGMRFDGVFESLLEDKREIAREIADGNIKVICFNEDLKNTLKRMVFRHTLDFYYVHNCYGTTSAEMDNFIINYFSNIFNSEVNENLA